MDKILTYTITSQEAGMQVLEFLRSKGFSRHILTSMKPVRGTSRKWSACRGTKHSKRRRFFRVRVMETATTEGIVPASLPLNILYEDEDILVLNKPADMPVHPSIGNYTNTLANAAAFISRKGEFCPFRCINRLDRDTSGALVLAKNALSAAILSAQMRNREIRRTYWLWSRCYSTVRNHLSSHRVVSPDSVIQRQVDPGMAKLRSHIMSGSPSK